MSVSMAQYGDFSDVHVYANSTSDFMKRLLHSQMGLRYNFVELLGLFVTTDVALLSLHKNGPTFQRKSYTTTNS